jgi:hypothetical protein
MSSSAIARNIRADLGQSTGEVHHRTMPNRNALRGPSHGGETASQRINDRCNSDIFNSVSGMGPDFG